MEESALKPIKMKINIYGSGNFDGDNIPFPDAYIIYLISLDPPEWFAEKYPDELIASIGSI